MKKVIAVCLLVSALFVLCLSSACASPYNGNGHIDSPSVKQEIELSRSTYAADFDAEYQITDGALYGRGMNSLCLFGDDDSAVFTEWVEIVDADNIIHIEAINGSVMYLTSGGQVYALGNAEGIAQEYDPNIDLPSLRTPYLISEDCKHASLGVGFVLMLRNDGSVWFQGASKNGQGREVADRIAQPRKIADNALFVKAFGYTSAWIDASYSLYMCGDNSYGQIGNGHDGSGFPTLYKDIVTEPYFTLGNCVELIVIDHTSVQAKTANGSVYAWGGEYGSAPKYGG